MASILTISIYSAAWVFLLDALVRKKSAAPTHILLGLVAAGLVAHGFAVYLSLLKSGGIELGFYNVAGLFFFVINTLVLVTSYRQPLQNLFIFLMPLSILGLIVNEFFHTPFTTAETLSPGMIVHILLSILAYSLLTIASMQALLLAYQNRQLKAKHFTGVMGLMPPLQTMESLLFNIVWAGFLFLTFSIITGAIYIDDIFAQKLSHKTLFSTLSWLIYAVLLAGHQMYGWRGAPAVRWVLGGFCALMLAYFGSKLVLEVILAS